MSAIRKIIFYGDSNTYGFDPRAFSGGRYPEREIWVSLVSDALKDLYEVENEGMNGRRIPSERDWRYDSVMIRPLSGNDIFAVMLGTNDILMNIEPDADRAIAKMDAFMNKIMEMPSHPRVMLIAPPCAGSENDPDPLFQLFYRECVKMNNGFRLIAENRGLDFADTSSWGVEKAFDRAHFSLNGHKTFAEKMIRFLTDMERRH